MNPVVHNGVEFEVFDCPLCGIALRCPKCGNNSCNGRYGEIDGKQCDTCPATYDAQDAHWNKLAQLDKKRRP